MHCKTKLILIKDKYVLALFTSLFWCCHEKSCKNVNIIYVVYFCPSVRLHIFKMLQKNEKKKHDNVEFNRKELADCNCGCNGNALREELRTFMDNVSVD